MLTSNAFYDENFTYFITEAQELLRSIEEDLSNLCQERSMATLHNLMRAAHTLKGAAASVGQRSIQEVSHILEDIFKALYSPDLEIDAEVKKLLFDGYECLRQPVVAAIHNSTIDDSEVMNTAASIIARLQDKFGESFNPDAPLPSSAEMGFDMVQSMFELGITQHLNQLQQIIETNDLIQITESLQDKMQMLLGFAESLDLPGFAAISTLTLSALQRHPDQVRAIAQVALKDLLNAREEVLNGDRILGGSPSEELQHWANTVFEPPFPKIDNKSHPSQSSSPSDQIYSENFEPTLTSELNSSEAIESLLDDIDLSTAYSFLQSDLENSSPALPTQTSYQDSYPSGDRSQASDIAHTALSLTSPSPSPLAEPTFAEAPVSELSKSQTGATSPDHRAAIAGHKPKSSIRVDIDQLDRLNYLTGELLINQNRHSTQDDQLRIHLQTLQNAMDAHQQLLFKLQDDLDQILIRTSAGQFKEYSGIFSSATFPSGTPEAIALYHSPHDDLQRHSSQLSPSRLHNFQTLHSLPGDFDALEMDRYSDLHSKIQTALAQFAALENNVESLTYLTKRTRTTVKAQQGLLTQVRDNLTEIRMAPIATVFNRLPTVLQQLEALHNKPIQLLLLGSDLLIDKTIVEKLYDPLLHLIRNAFDHGIESIDQRRSLGKPTTGQITVEAYQQGNRAVIEIRDDGAGIDLQKVAQQAIKLNLATPETIKKYSSDRILEFLFSPGFSTRSQISSLSGRGIGLDVVRVQIESMGGSIAVQSVPHQGSNFTLQIPLSLTVTKLMVCQSQGISYALPIKPIDRVLLPKPEQIQNTSHGHPVLKLIEKDQVQFIPLLPLHHLFKYSHSAQTLIQLRKEFTNPTVQNQPILLLNLRQDRWAVQVDRIIGEQELVIRQLQGFTPPPYVYGGATLGNNELALAIDPELLLANYVQPSGLSQLPELRSLPEYPPSSSILPTNPTQVLLVVDDSVTLRQMLTQTLKQQGYEVIQAQDGQDALEKLRQHPHISLVLCDIEMPRINGFEFLTHARQTIDPAKVPIVMLTSRSADKHRHLALSLGASAYLTKPYSQDELLNTISQFIS